MIVLDKVNKIYTDNAGNRVHALRNISLNIAEGSFITVIGANGSGKSTLVKILTGAERISSGSIRIHGEEVGTQPVARRSSAVAHIFQNPERGVAGSLSVIENFRIAYLRGKYKSPFTIMGSAFIKEVGEQIAALGMGLEGMMDMPIGLLSGGQRQALSLLMAVQAPCRLLLMDEPTAALDPKSARQVIQLANHIIRERALSCIFVTHNMKEALDYGDRLIQMYNGSIIKDIDKRSWDRPDSITLQSWFEEEPEEI